MILCFQESNGDYLAIDTATNAHYVRNFGEDHFESRATAIAGLVSSVCTTAVYRAYLRANCKKVARAKVPFEWRKAVGL